MLPSRAVAQRNGNRALGGLLSYNVLVQLGDDFARSEFVEIDVLVFSGSWEIYGHMK